jgi:CheY-like chemotaxis protein
LALVRQLVILHGGRVLVSSPGVGAGATFGISQPIAHPASAQPVQSEPAPPERVATAAPSARAAALGGAALELERAVEQPPLPPPAPVPVAMFERCVIVDDDVDSAETVALMLERWGFTAQVAHDASGALEAIDRLHPELVLLDLTLPGLERYFLIEQVRRKLGSAVRAVAITGHADDEVRREALDHGFDDLLVKPISAEQLAAAASRSSIPSS